MRSLIAPLSKSVCVWLVLLVGTVPSVQAQDMDTLPHQQVVSANPFGLLFDLFNAEYERVVTPSSTAGVGGSAYFRSEDDYVNADVFWRYYPQGTPLSGWMFGVKAGVTSVGDEGTYLGAGFDVNRSWVLGRSDNFYIGIGLGLKRMYVSTDASFDLKYIPTLRIINVGYAF